MESDGPTRLSLGQNDPEGAPIGETLEKFSPDAPLLPLSLATTEGGRAPTAGALPAMVGPPLMLLFPLLPPLSTTPARARHHKKVADGLQWRLQADGGGGGAVAGPFAGARVPLAGERAAVERPGRGALFWVVW
jgi:hypothetical protein